MIVAGWIVSLRVAMFYTRRSVSGFYSLSIVSGMLLLHHFDFDDPPQAGANVSSVFSKEKVMFRPEVIVDVMQCIAIILVCVGCIRNSILISRKCLA